MVSIHHKSLTTVSGGTATVVIQAMLASSCTTSQVASLATSVFQVMAVLVHLQNASVG